MDRLMPFGRYYHFEIKRLIIRYLDYIVWCLKRGAIELNEEEQALYDAYVIALIKSGVSTICAYSEMAAYVKDKEALRNRKSPIIVTSEGHIMRYKSSDPIVLEAIRYRKYVCTKRSKKLVPDDEEFILTCCDLE